MNETVHFPAWLKERRKALDLTQVALARLAGCSGETVRKIEAGVLNPSKQLAELLAAALGVSEREWPAFVRFARGVAEPQPAPAPVSVQARPVSHSNLPNPLTAFIGREREAREVSSLLRRPEVRIVTLTGPPGIGKTRLSLHVAAAIAEEFTDLYYVPLAAISDPALVASTIARSLDVRETSDRSLPDALKRYLRDREALLVLDNFEQVVSAAPLLAELLSASPKAKLLVTSRTILHIYGEHTFPVPPLSLPPLHPQERRSVGARHASPPQIYPTHLAEYEAVRLFVERAGATRHGFALTDENSTAIVEICRRLDGLPLAIELAANQVRTFTPEIIAQRLALHIPQRPVTSPPSEGRLDTLTGGPQDLPARQQTLRGAIAWSYDLLDEEEKTAFRSLSVFTDFGRPEGTRILDFGLASSTIQNLMDKSLLRRDDQSGEPRVSMLETIREYAWERLVESGEAGEWRSRHAAYFMEIVEQAERELQGPEQSAWLDRLDREHANLRAAMTYALEDGDPETAGRIAASLRRFWYLRAHITEGRAWLQRVLEQSDRLSAQVRASVLHGTGTLAWSQGDFPSARSFFAASLDIWRELGDRHGVANMLHNLGVAALSLGDLDAARGYHEESLPSFRDFDDKWSVALSLANLGLVALHKGEYESAAALLRESLDLRRTLGDRQGIAQSLNNLGTVMRCRNDYDQALTFHDEALGIFRELNDGWSIALSLANLGLVALGQGIEEKAARRFTESIGMFRDLGVKQGIATCLEGLAEVGARAGDPERAATLYGAADALREATVAIRPPYEDADYQRGLAFTRAALSDAAFAGAWERGRTLDVDQAIEMATPTDR